MIKNAIELKELRQLLLSHGTYDVLLAVQRITQENSESHPKDAVIHRDLKVLSVCVFQMKDNHPLRTFEE
jgi:hypothetical protein